MDGIGADPAFLRLIRKCAPKLSPSEIRDSLRRADIRISMPAVQTPVISASEPITATRQSEPSPTNDDESDTVTERRAPTPLGVTISDLITAGLLQPPVSLVRDYKGTHLTATIDPNGMITCQGQAYDSLSTSAGIARRSVIGTPPGREYPATNGWTFWKLQDPDSGDMVEVDVLRQRYLGSNAGQE